jgi:hypothetical protein
MSEERLKVDDASDGEEEQPRGRERYAVDAPGWKIGPTIWSDGLYRANSQLSAAGT